MKTSFSRLNLRTKFRFKSYLEKGLSIVWLMKMFMENQLISHILGETGDSNLAS
jgi:hypothetical protein